MDDILQHAFHAPQVGDLRAHVGQVDRSKAPGLRARLVALVHKTQQGAHFLEREPELPRPQHESKPPLMHRVIASVPVGCPRRRPQETDLFIIAHGFEVGARPPGEFGPPIDAFRADDTRGKHAACANHVLRVQLRQVGRLGDRFSEVRDGLQGLGRIVAYTDQYACEWSGGALKPRLAGLRGDIHSLIEYEEQLSSKVQFVPDALVGLIGIAQNDVFKVLTIVSIVGIPPTLVAGSMA
jgi:Mg2+ and Co2+ transporter CorA